MQVFNNNEYVYYPSGFPCKHNGCSSHRTHPCEVCGRIESKGESFVLKYIEEKDARRKNNRNSRENCIQK